MQRTGFGTKLKNKMAKWTGTTRKVKHLNAVIEPSRYNIMNSEQKEKYIKMEEPDVYVLKPEFATLQDRITMAEHTIWYPLEEWEYRGMDEYETDKALVDKAKEMLEEKRNLRYQLELLGPKQGGKRTRHKKYKNKSRKIQ
jgi:hypothetical protein